MAKDFSAHQIRGAQLLASGGIPGSTAGLFIYTASDAGTSFTGTFPDRLLTGVGTDVFMFVSGSRDSKVGKGIPGALDSALSHMPAGVTLFGGDVVVSGTLYAEKQVVEVNQASTGSHYVQGNMYVSSSLFVDGGASFNVTKGGTFPDQVFAVKVPAGDALAVFGSTTPDSVYINSANGDIDFLVKADDGTTSLFSDASTARIGIGTTTPTDAKLDIVYQGTQQRWAWDSDSYALMTVSNGSNVTIANGETGLITIDSGGGIALDTASGDISLKDNGTDQLTIDMDGTGGQVDIQLKVNSDDLVFKQYDGNEVIRIADDRKLYFYDQGGEHISSDGTDMTIAAGGDIKLSAATGVEIQTGVSLYLDGTGHDDEISSNGTNLTIAAGGGDIILDAEDDIILDANGATITFKDNNADGLEFQHLGAGDWAITPNGGDLVVAGNLTVDEYISHTGDADTYMRFQGDSWNLTAGGVNLIDAVEGTQDRIVINEGGVNVDFRIETTNKVAGLLVDASADMVLVLSGGAGASVNESLGKDISFYVSGSRSSAGVTTVHDALNGVYARGTSVFGGDLHVSGNTVIGTKAYGSPGLYTCEVNRVAAGNIFTAGSDAYGGSILSVATTGVDILGINGVGDVKFFVSGAIHSDGATVANKAYSLFGGDLVVSGTAVFNPGGLAVADFRVESNGEDEALFVDSSANALYINRGETAFSTRISSVNDIAITVASAGVIFNEDGHATNDFRVESDSDAYVLFADAGTNKVGIGANVPDTKLHVATTGHTGITIEGGANDGAGDPHVSLQTNGAVQFTAGVDHSDGNKFKIVTGSALGTAANNRLEINASEVVLNQGSADIDFRVEGNGLLSLLHCDAGNDRVGIGVATPKAEFQVGAGSGPQTIIINSDGTKSGSVAFIKDNGTTRGALVLDYLENMILVQSGSGKSIQLKTEDAGKTWTNFEIAPSANGNQVLVLSGNSVGATNPQGATDTNFWVSGSVGSRGSTNNRGTAVFGGDLHISGTITSDYGIGQWKDGGTFLYPADSTGAEHLVLGGETLGNADILLAADGAATFNEQSNSVDFRVESNGVTHMLFVDGSEDAVGIGTSTPVGTLHIKDGASGTTSVDANGDNLIVEGNTNAGISILAGSIHQAAIYFPDSSDTDIGAIKYDHGGNQLTFRANAGDHMCITSAGNVGVGIGDPDTKLEIFKAGTQLKLSYDADSNATIAVADSSHTTLATAESGNLTLDVAGDIELNADGGQVSIKDGAASHFLLDCDNTAFTIYDDTNVADYCSITVAASGLTTIATNDNDGTSGNIKLMPDGFVGIGVNPAMMLDVASTASPVARFKNTADNSAGGLIRLENTRNNTEGEADDFAGGVVFYAQDSAQNATQYGKISTKIQSPTNGAETGFMQFEVTTGGTIADTPLLLRGDRALILSGGAGASYDETSGNDVTFFVSGSKSSRGTAVRGTAVFGGDIYASGTLVTNTIQASSTSKIQFYDSGLAVGAAADGKLVISSDGTDGDAIKLDSAGGIILDADSGKIKLHDNGSVFGRFQNSSNNLVVSASTHNKDVILRGNNATEVARVDGSANSLLIASEKQIQFGATTEYIANGSSNSLTVAANGNMVLDSGGDIEINADGAEVTFKDGSTTAMIFDMDARAGACAIQNGAGNTVALIDDGDRKLYLYDFGGEYLASDGTDLTIASGGDINIVAGGGDFLPSVDGTINLGSAAKRWANVYTGDLHLKNEKGDWTILEERDYLCVVNNITGKKYKMSLEPLEDDE